MDCEARAYSEGDQVFLGVKVHFEQRLIAFDALYSQLERAENVHRGGGSREWVCGIL